MYMNVLLLLIIVLYYCTVLYCCCFFRFVVQCCLLLLVSSLVRIPIVRLIDRPIDRSSVLVVLVGRNVNLMHATYPARSRCSSVVPLQPPSLSRSSLSFLSVPFLVLVSPLIASVRLAFSSGCLVLCSPFHCLHHFSCIGATVA